MTYRILTKKSNVADLQPHPSELVPGELALNYSDMILYALDSNGYVQQVSSSGGGGGDLVAMDYTFWVRVVPEDADGVARSRFDGLDDNGNSYDVNLEGFDVALNGVSLVPVTDYQIDQTALILSEPAEPGDVVIIRSLKPSEGFSGGEVTTATVMLIGDDTSQPTPQAYKDWLTRNNLQTQQDANWHLLHMIDDLEIPDEFDPSGLVTEDELAAAIDPLATEEWVIGQGYITEQPLNDAIDEVVQNQLEKDQSQDNDIKLLESRVSQIESVSLDARYRFEGDGTIPRDGEFTILAGSEVATEWENANGLIFSENAIEGKPEWDKVVEGDIIRLGGSTSSGIAPAEADSFAEFKVTGRAGPSSFLVDLVRSASHPLDGVEYGVLLLSSFDPTGLATTEFVLEVSGQTLDASKQYTDNKLVDYIPKAGGDVTGKLRFKSGGGIDGLSNSDMDGRSSCNIRVSADRPLTIETGSNYKPVLKVLRYEDQEGANHDRAYAPFCLWASGNIDAYNIHAAGNVTVDKDLILAGGDGKQNILAKQGFSGYLCYGNEGSEDTRRLAWGSQTVWLYKKLTMQGNKIYNVADPDPADDGGVVTVNFLNGALDEALGQIDVAPDLDTLDARYLNLSSSSVQKVTGAVEISSSSTTVNKFKVGNGTYTSFFIKGNGHAAYFRGSIYVNANEENGTTNHGGKKLATEEYADGKATSDATQSVKGKTYLGQAITGTSTNPTLKEGQLYFNRTKKRLYVGF